MRFGILGPLEVADEGGRALGLGGRKQRAVLAILLLHANEAVSQDRLVEELWPGAPPASAAPTLQAYVSRLRRALGGDQRIVTTGGGYLIRVAPGELDWDRFERLVEEGGSALSSGELELASRTLREALGLWRGAPLSDFAYDSFAQAEIARLEELHLAAVEQRIEAELALGREAPVIGDLERLVREHPYRERLHGQLMLALYRTGRQAEALEAYRNARSVLVDELGIEPSRELGELHEAILNQDPSLLRPRPDVERAGLEQLRRRHAAPPPLAEEAPVVREASGTTGPLAPLGATNSRRQARKVVTALFCDVSGSTALGEQLDPEVLREVLGRYFAEIRAIVERHGGTVEKFIGDAVMAVFGIPRVHEDDALRGVRVAVEIRERLPTVAADVGVELRFRTGVNTGRVLIAEGENLAVGDAINVAARLEQAAQPGEILIGDETLRLVRDAVEVEELEPLELRGKTEPVTAYRLLRVDRAASGFARHLDMPLVGRERELRLLSEAWDRAVEESGCHLFTLLGEAGVGKSRLVAELPSGIGEQATLLGGRCLHYGEGITFWPLVEALMPVGEPAQGVLEHLSSGGMAAREELFWEVRRLLETLAAERPVILHIDDLQWAEPMLLDLLDHIADLSRGAPILLLCTARMELLEERPGWGGGKLNATTVLLEPLAPADSEALLDELGDGLDPAARARVIAASEGNPLFLEEMVALARERGTVEAPPTIQALLAARLERLGPEELELLERGAVEGEVFHRMAVKALAGERLAAEADLRLAGLVRKELIRPHPPTINNDEAFRFRHLLIRDAAYDGLPKSTRAELHERFARWLEAATADLLEPDEIAGWHFEQAIRYARELGRPVEPELARSAVRHLHTAGRRAVARSDVGAATNLLTRALGVAPVGDPVHSQIAIELAEQLVQTGEFARADELIAVAEQGQAEDPRVVLTRLDLMRASHPHEASGEIDARLPRLIERLTETGDQRGLAKAHLLASGRYCAACLSRPWAEHARLAAGYADRGGDELLKAHALGEYILALVLGPADARTIAREVEMVQRQQPGPYLQARIDVGRGVVCRLEGEFDEALRLTERAIEQVHSLGMRWAEARSAGHLAMIHLAASDPMAAVPALQQADEFLAEKGERGYRSTIQAMLAWSYAFGGDLDAARAACDLADDLTAPDDIINFMDTSLARARIALAEGDGQQAEEQARTAVDHAFRTDQVFEQAAAKLELAHVLASLGRAAEARPEAREALAINEAKGDRPGMAKAQAMLDEL